MGACPITELTLGLGLLSSFRPADGPGWLGPGCVQPSGIDLSNVHLRHLARRLATHRLQIGSRLAAPRAGTPGSVGPGPSVLWPCLHAWPRIRLGRLLWASPTLPGITHDLAAGREHGIVEAPADTGIRCWTDKAHQLPPPSGAMSCDVHMQCGRLGHRADSSRQASRIAIRGRAGRPSRQRVGVIEVFEGRERAVPVVPGFGDSAVAHESARENTQGGRLAEAIAEFLV